MKEMEKDRKNDRSITKAMIIMRRKGTMRIDIVEKDPMKDRNSNIGTQNMKTQGTGITEAKKSTRA